MSSADRIPGGYIIIAKKIIDSEIWNKPPLYLKVWLYLLQRAQYKEYKNLKKGQLFVTIKDIQESCAWFIGCRKSTPTKDQIFQILNWMRKPSVSPMKATTKATMITTTKATHGILITIDNYCAYQNPKLYESNDESNDETATKATGKQRTTNNINKEEIKKDKNLITTDLDITLSEFKAMRDKIKKPLTDHAEKLLMAKLDKMATTEQGKIEILNQSIMNCWQGIFEVKGDRENVRFVQARTNMGANGGGKTASGVPEDFWG